MLKGLFIKKLNIWFNYPHNISIYLFFSSAKHKFICLKNVSVVSFCPYNERTKPIYIMTHDAPIRFDDFGTSPYLIWALYTQVYQ